MKIEDIIIDNFVKEVTFIAEDWTREIAEGKEPIHKYADQIFHIHNIIKNILAEDEPK